MSAEALLDRVHLTGFQRRVLLAAAASLECEGALRTRPYNYALAHQHVYTPPAASRREKALRARRHRR